MTPLAVVAFKVLIVVVFVCLLFKGSYRKPPRRYLDR